MAYIAVPIISLFWCPSMSNLLLTFWNFSIISNNRRSLLSQSPMLRFPSGSPTPSPHSSAVTTTRTSETGNCSGKPPFSLHSPITDHPNCSITSKGSKPYLHVNHSAETVPCTTGSPLKTEGRKRKLSFCPSNSVPAINLEKEFQLQCANNELLIDDQFYDGIDFDAVEAQAKLLLKQKSGALMTQKQETIVPQHLQSPRFDSPSFDLGIWLVGEFRLKGKKHYWTVQLWYQLNIAVW